MQQSSNKFDFCSLAVTFVRNILPGIIIAIFSVWLTSSWENNQQDNSMLTTLREELCQNKADSLWNIEHLEKDMEERNKNSGVINSPLEMRSTWELIQGKIPAKIVNNKEGLEKIRVVSRIANEINLTLHNRELYKIFNEGNLDNFNTRMKIYDDILLERSRKLVERINEIENLLNFNCSK